MNNRVNYTIVGALVLIGVIGMGFFGFWLLKPAKESEVESYIVYFNESVLGLNIDAPVKYKGFSVGKVVKLSLSQDNLEQVEVLIEILKETPIKTSTEAQLTSQGITGLSYINLTSNNQTDAKPLAADAKREYPVIKSIPSTLVKLESRFLDMFEDLTETLQMIRELFKDDNQHNFSLLVKNSADMMGKINQTLDEETINNFKNTAKNLNSASKKLEKLMPQIDKFIDKSVNFEDNISAAFDSIKNSYLSVENAMDTINRALESGEFNIKEMSSDILPTMNSAFLDMQNLIIEIQETLKKHERSPADLLFMQEEIKKGPGEK
ncbi:MlaD family protein [Sulfurimonas sp.]|jgi:phospholipid/cholesterol/gamma-HCH transport system substrate-binding protein|uniref:MlaD family protein n=1 Tax=Sulfurimonas sp. TaxID=2022749 RepID=UPI0025FEC938|nr:MlaD family protein [Sulfurimonas sp.]MCK9473871.1 MlaD family protein [Sulfurimonas sp.]MDD3505310.1 MlaD family protein [Sulfurimonas sp.]